MSSFYQEIQNNRRRSIFVVIFFVVFTIGIGYILSIYFNSQYFLPIAILYSLASSFSGYFWGDKIVLALNKAIPATREKYFNFYTATENLSSVAKIPVPKIYVIESEAMNAFATGRNPQNAVICATTGLLNKLDKTELEGVIGHELSHIKNNDILLMTIVSVLIGTLSILINLASRQLFWGNNRDNDRRESSGILMIFGMLLIIFAPFIAQLIQLAISRRREYLADATSVSFTRQPSGLIKALQKISNDPVLFKEASTATATLYISNPFKGDKIASLFYTHPPIKDRIKALELMM
jgi:heat shock protein HtpX